LAASFIVGATSANFSDIQRCPLFGRDGLNNGRGAIKGANIEPQ